MATQPGTPVVQPSATWIRSLGMEASVDLSRCRTLYRANAWLRALECLKKADRMKPLDPADLERCATSAYMLGLDDDYVESLKSAHDAYLESGDTPRAVRCAFWIGHSLMFRGETARGTGWFERAKRLLDRAGEDCVEHGYLRIPEWLRQSGRGDYDAALRLAEEAAAIGERFGEADLIWLARDDQAKALLMLGRVDEGLRLVDEALVVASMGELSPIVTGIVYCNTIAFCRATYELRRVREWTKALSAWCEQQPEMVTHNGLCLVHRAEILLMEGDWTSALEEARRSAERFTRGMLNQMACGRAHYCQGEVHRLRGDFEAAEAAYRRASLQGCEPQPGLALMRLSQGDSEAAAAAIRRVITETTSDLRRAAIMPACVEIALSTGDLGRAKAACRELEDISERHPSEIIGAMTSQCRGAVDLAEGRPSEALTALRSALAIWTELRAVYEVARLRARIGKACRMLGDEDAATMEEEAAHRAFEDLGARPDPPRLGTTGDGGAPSAQDLTTRQLEVLRLVAAGMTNREIADELFVSEHTIARHVQNIFARLNVSSRTAAAAFAFENGLL